MRKPFTKWFAAVLVLLMLPTAAAHGAKAKLRMVVASPGYMWGIDEQVVTELKAEGVEVVAYPDAPMIDGGNQPPVIRSWEQLRRCNVLIFGDQFYNRGQPSADTGEMPAQIRRTVPLLYRFLEEGGGIFFSGPGEADFGNSVRTMNYIMKELDARAVQEVIRDSGNLITVAPSGGFREWCWTNAIGEHPLTRGVKGLWYPVAHGGDGGMGIVPIEAGPAWQILVKGMTTAASYGIDPADAAGTRLLKTPGIIKSAPKMIAVRQYGKGRVAFWPMWSSFGVFSGSRFADGLLMDGERDGRKSDGKQLIKNLLRWLAEPSQGSKTVGLFDPEKAAPPEPPAVDVRAKLAAWCSKGRRDYPNQFKGIIGAHSSLSDGRSSPEQMIAAAKKAGYDFIAFTEDLSMMDEGKWNRFVAACDGAVSGPVYLTNVQNSGWNSRKLFSAPISVEFIGVSLDTAPRSGWNNVGLAPAGLGPDTIGWVFDGSVKPNALVPIRCVAGKGLWPEGYRKAVLFTKLPDLTKRQNAIDLRIDWWPAKRLCYYLNGRAMAEFTASVPAGPLPVGVRSETVGFRFDGIRVTRLDGRKEVLLYDDFSRSEKLDLAKNWHVAHGGPPTIRRDTKFVAYPGLDFLDDAGNRSVMFGNRWWPPKDAFSEKHPGRLKWLYGVSYLVSHRPATWPPRIIIRSKTNNKRPWHQALWSLFAPYCYEGGKLADDSFDEWRRLIKRHVFFMNSGIVAVHTVRDAGEITASAREGLYQTHVRADNLPQALSRLCGCVGPLGYFSSYISSGPEIVDFRAHAVSAGEGVDLAVPGNDRIPLHILVRAKAGLKEVAVYDGERLVRRFLPTGVQFEQFLTFHSDEHHAFSLTVVDKNDRRAVSWTAWMQIQERVHRRCGDNWNYMRTGKGRRAVPPYPHILEATSRAGGPPTYFGEPASMHHGGLQSATGRYIAPDFQNLRVDGKPWPGNYPALTMDFATVGRYGEIVTNVIRQDYVVKRPDGYTTGAFGGPYAVIDSPWPAELEQWAPEPRFNGPVVSRYAGKVAFKRSVSTPDGKPVRVGMGSSDARGHNPVGKRGCVLEVMQPDGTSRRYFMSALKDDSSYTGEIPVNGYVAWYGPDAPGLGGVIALSPGIKYNFYKRGNYSWLSFLKELPSPVKPGTEVAWECLYVSGSGITTNSSAEMEDVRLGMGIAGPPTFYKVEARAGKVVDRRFFLTLEAEDHAFSGRIVKAYARPLPIHLPVIVRGLNRRWDAGIWYRGRTRLEVVHKFRDRWGVESPYRMTATYEVRDDELQWIPVLDGGVGYCQIDTDKQDPDLFIGNFLVCDQPEVFISLVEATRGKCTFEINNPTDRKLKCTVRPAAGFDLTGKWQRSFTLLRGTIVTATAPTP